MPLQPLGAKSAPPPAGHVNENPKSSRVQPWSLPKILFPPASLIPTIHIASPPVLLSLRQDSNLLSTRSLHTNRTTLDEIVFLQVTPSSFHPSTTPFLHATLSSCDLRILPSRRMSVFYRQINLQASPICRANFCGIFVLPFWVRFGANLLRGFHRRICDKISLSSIDLIPSQKPSIWEFGQGFPFSRVSRKLEMNSQSLIL